MRGWSINKVVGQAIVEFLLLFPALILLLGTGLSVMEHIIARVEQEKSLSDQMMELKSRRRFRQYRRYMRHDRRSISPNLFQRDRRKGVVSEKIEFGDS